MQKVQPVGSRSCGAQSMGAPDRKAWEAEELVFAAAARYPSYAVKRKKYSSTKVRSRAFFSNTFLTHRKVIAAPISACWTSHWEMLSVDRKPGHFRSYWPREAAFLAPCYPSSPSPLPPLTLRTNYLRKDHFFLVFPHIASTRKLAPHNTKDPAFP